MPDNTSGEKKNAFVSKNVKLGKTVILAVAFIILGVLFTVLNNNGVTIYRFGEGKNTSVMFYLAFVCYCGIGYCLMTLATFARIKLSRGTDSQVSISRRCSGSRRSSPGLSASRWCWASFRSLPPRSRRSPE